MSKYVRKYQQGEQITSLSKAIEHILSGGHVYYRHKFMHYGFAGGMSLLAIHCAVRNKSLFKAEKVKRLVS